MWFFRKKNNPFKRDSNNIKALPEYQSKSQNSSILKVYHAIMKETSNSFWDFHVDKKAMIAHVESMNKASLKALREDIPNWTDSQRNYFREILWAATDFDKTVRWARILFADQWKLTKIRSTIYDIYLPIFLFSIFEIRIIDYTYRTDVLPKIKALSASDLQFLKEEATQWTKDQQKELQLIIGHTSNYDNLYLHILTSRKSESWKTQSTNPNILAIYEILVESENHDTDYWWCGIGASDMAQVFYKFTPKDWQELEEDLKYWTNFQLEMFIYGILDEGFSNQQQFDLIIPLLKIGKLPDRQSNDIAFTVLDEMYFLDILFEKLKEEPTTLPKMKEIFELLEVEAYDEAFSILKKKIYG